MASSHSTSGTTALATASGMIFALTAGTTYNFEFQVGHDGITTMGLKLGLTFPAVTMVFARAEIASSNVAQVIGYIEASGGSVTSTGSFGATRLMSRVEGTILPSGNGNLALVWGCEASTTGGVRILQQTLGYLYAVAP
jgi:hypothetical protein